MPRGTERAIPRGIVALVKKGLWMGFDGLDEAVDSEPLMASPPSFSCVFPLTGETYPQTA
jgi:hypothetical protein